MFGARPSIAQPIVAPIWLTISTILRPILSETLPQSGAETSWQNEKVATNSPTTTAEAPKCVTKYGSIGISMLKPTMSMNVTPRIGRSLRIMLARSFAARTAATLPAGRSARNARSCARRRPYKDG